MNVHDPRTKTSRRGFRPLPRYRDHMNRIALDKAKIKAIYMAQPFYKFKDFFLAQGWEPKTRLIQEIGFRTWQREWIETRTEEEDENVIARAVTLRQSVSTKRLDFIQFWTELYDPMSYLIRGTTSMYANAMNAAIQEANEKGQPHTALEIVKRKHKYWASEMEALMAAGHKLQKVQMTGLMLNEKDVEAISTRIRVRTPEEREQDISGEEIQNMPMGVMDQTGSLVPVDQAQNLITKWYDQLTTSSAHHPESSTEEPIDAEFTSDDEDLGESGDPEELA